MTLPLPNERQLDVLTWIADGCPERQWPDHTYKTSALALQNRHLATVSKKGGLWRAEITQSGRYLLEHGVYPPRADDDDATSRRPPKRPTVRREVPRSRRAVRPVAKALPPTEQLVADVLTAGGELTVDRSDGVNYELRVSSAIRFGKVPDGKLLTIRRGGNWNEQIVSLTDPPDWMTEQLTPLAVTDRLGRVHPAVQGLRSDRERLRFKSGIRGRAVRIFQALAAEAEARGFKVAPAPSSELYERRPTEVTDGLSFTVRGHAFEVSVREQTDRVPHIPTAQEMRDAEGPWARRIPKYDHVENGHLTFCVTNGHLFRQSCWSESDRFDIGRQLAEILQELELRAGFEEERRLEEERRKAERRRQWEAAMEKARARLAEAHQAKVLKDQLERWQRANALDGYLAAFRQVVATMDDAEPRDRATEWLTWAERYRTRIDPLTRPLEMPKTPEPTAENLKPYLGRWSFYGPESSGYW